MLFMTVLVPLSAPGPGARLVAALRRGATAQAAANYAGVSLERVQVLLEQIGRVNQAKGLDPQGGCQPGKCTKCVSCPFI